MPLKSGTQKSRPMGGGKEVLEMTGHMITIIFNSVTAVCNIIVMILFYVWYGPNSKR